MGQCLSSGVPPTQAPPADPVPSGPTTAPPAKPVPLEVAFSTAVVSRVHAPYADPVELTSDQPPVLLSGPAAVSLSSASFDASTAELAINSVPQLPAAVVQQIYHRAFYLYHSPLSALSWKEYQGANGRFWHSLLTSEYRTVEPSPLVKLQPSDYLLRLTPECFPALLSLCSTLNMSLHFAPSALPANIPDPFYNSQIRACAPSLPALLCFIPHFIAALSIYPPSLFAAMGWREVWLCESVTFDWLLPDGKYDRRSIWVLCFASQRLYINCERLDSIQLLSNLHHELFHFIDYTMHRAQHNAAASAASSPNDLLTTFQAAADPVWSTFNPLFHRYGAGDTLRRLSTLTNSGALHGWKVKGPFVNRYSQSALAEDRAEVWAALVRDRESVRRATSAGIRHKGAELERRVREWSGGLLDEAWWQRTQRGGQGAGYSHTRHEKKLWLSSNAPTGEEFWYHTRTQQTVYVNPNIY